MGTAHVNLRGGIVDDRSYGDLGEKVFDGSAVWNDICAKHNRGKSGGWVVCVVIEMHKCLTRHCVLTPPRLAK